MIWKTEDGKRQITVYLLLQHTQGQVWIDNFLESVNCMLQTGVLNVSSAVPSSHQEDLACSVHEKSSQAGNCSVGNISTKAYTCGLFPEKYRNFDLQNR